MLGASGEDQTIALPVGRYGRPDLTLAELWSKKGVAAMIVQAIDRKSAILLGLILVVCLLFLANAAAAHPAAAVHRAVCPPGRRAGRRRRRLADLALDNLRRTPGRTALGAVALALGIAGLTLVAAVTGTFHGRITGTLLGDAVSVRVRSVDVLAVVAIVLIGAFAVADVLYLNVRDRAAELATLQATGWSNAALGRLITYEGLGMGFIGAVLGAGTGPTETGVEPARTNSPVDLAGPAAGRSTSTEAAAGHVTERGAMCPFRIVMCGRSAS